MLHTSPQFLSAFAEKAELLGMNRQQFEERFTDIPIEQLPSIPPAFTTSFVKFFHHRQNTQIPEVRR